jgi:NADH dehydrogenase
MTNTGEKQHRVVIVGGGFGGLNAAKSLRNAPVEITLIDRRNFHLFQPLLYQVATGALSAANIAAPLRAIMKHQHNTRVYLAEATEIDVKGRHVCLSDGECVPYDTLILATGAHHQYFGHDDWAEVAPGLKTVEDATNIRHRIYRAFEAAEREKDPVKLEELLTFVVIGAGPTGVEMAGALCEIAGHTLIKEFRRIDSSQAKVILLERCPVVLNGYPPELSKKAAEQLVQLGVIVRTGVTVTDVRQGRVAIEAEGHCETIAAHTVLWAAGVEASHLGGELATKAGAQLDNVERVIIEPDLTVPGHPEIMVIGDIAHYKDPKSGRPLPGVAQVAIQQGRYAAKTVLARLSGTSAPGPFVYHNLGSMATIGRSQAVADLFGVHLSGIPAWMVWLFVHLMSLVAFESRVLVFIQWAFSYLTWSRTARLITGEPPVVFRHGEHE